MIIGNWITMRERWSDSGEVGPDGVRLWRADLIEAFPRSQVTGSLVLDGLVFDVNGDEMTWGSAAHEWYLSQPAGWLSLDHDGVDETTAVLTATASGEAAVGYAPGTMTAAQVRRLFRGAYVYARQADTPIVACFDLLAAYDGRSFAIGGGG